MKRNLIALGLPAALAAGILLGRQAGPWAQVAAAQSDEPLQIPVSMIEYQFDPGEFVVKAGQPVQFVLTNNGTERHRFNVGGFGDRWRSSDPEPGDSTTLDVTFTEPGVYEVWCSVATPDGQPHRSLGMEGTLTVVE
ncbi:MAG TPA: cupredoxin domain-containing protein [Chloroflexota bacterium]|nr:cupredoxin domain-containing protein [Chloroflexota bacterium]